MASEGFDVYVVADACGGASKEAHNMALQRMIQAGVIPVTWEQVLLEFQRDWGNKETYDAVMQIIQEHGGAYGIGVEYANYMIPQPSYSR
jgi:nicotinamidase-related amidase